MTPWPGVVSMILTLTSGWVAQPGLAPSSDPALSVTPEVRTIETGDPLLLKITIHNPTGRTVTLRTHLMSSWGGLRFELRQPGSQQFERVFVPGAGSKGGMVTPPALKPGESLSTYEQLFVHRKTGQGPIFATPGVWHIRAVTTCDGRSIESPAVPIEVRPRGVRSDRALASCLGELSLAIRSVGLPISEYWEAILTAQDELGESNASQTITRLRLIDNLWLAGRYSRSQCLEEIDCYLVVMSGPGREFLELRTVDVLLDRKEYDDAETRLARITEPSYYRAELLARLQDARQK